MNPPTATPARITLPRDHPDVQAAARAGHALIPELDRQREAQSHQRHNNHKLTQPSINIS